MKNITNLTLVGIFVFIAASVSMSAKETKVIFSETFNKPTSELALNGWTLDGNTKTVDDGGANCLQVIGHDRKRTLSYVYFKVKPGKRYAISCQIKTEGISQDRRRGATIFAEWVDKDNQFVPGGTYPKGKGGSSPWADFTISYTGVVPESVDAVKLYVGVEGQGKGSAWFRNLVVEEYVDGLVLSLKKPADRAGLTDRRPMLSWQNIDRNCQVVIASNRSLSRKRQRFSVGSKDSLLLPYFLDAGTTWYWQVQETTKLDSASGQKPYCSEIQSFRIAKDARQWPPIAESQFKWSDAPRPTLISQILAPDDMDIKVDIDGSLAETISFQNGLLKFKPLQDISAAVHEISLHFTDSQGEQYTAVDDYSNVKPGSRVSYKEGMTYVNDEAFFPIGAYCDPSDDPLEFSGLVEAGFNFAHSYVFEREETTDTLMDTAKRHLEAAEKNDIKIFLGMPRGWTKKQMNPEIKEWVSTLMTYPSLTAWYIMDEPSHQNIGVQYIGNSTELIKRIDPFHPSMVAFQNLVARQSQLAKDYIERVDIVACDPYPLMRKKSFTTVDEWVINCRKMAGKTKPVWSIIEAFDADYDSGGIKRGQVAKYGPVTKPTYNQMKCQSFLSLSAGADGIIFYWMSRPRYDMKKDAPAVWDSMCKLVKELQAVTSFMTTPRSFTKLSVKVPEPFRVWVRSNKKGETAIAFINPLEKAQSLKVSLPLGDKKLYAEGKIIQIEGGLYESDFKPYETKVYIIK
jgi:hypothetical protein